MVSGVLHCLGRFDTARCQAPWICAFVWVEVTDKVGALVWPLVQCVVCVFVGTC